MKQLLTAIAIFISLSAFSQKSAYDSTKKDSIPPPRVYAIVLSEPEVQELFKWIDSTDEKPSRIREYKSFLISRAQLVPPPKNKPNDPH